MARTAKEPVEVIENDELPNEDEVLDESAVSPVLTRMQILMEQMRADETASIEIYRVGKHDRDLTLVDVVDPENYEPMMLRQPPFNGGTFRVCGKLNGKMVFNPVVKVEPLPIIPISTHPPVDINPVLLAIQKQGEQMQAFMMAQTSQKPQESRADFLKEMIMFKELFSSNQPAVPQHDPLKMLKDVLEIQQLSGGGGGEGASPMMLMAMKMLDKFGDMAGKQTAQTPVQALPVQTSQEPTYAQPVYAMPTETAFDPPTETTEEENMFGMIKEVVEAAEKKADTTVFAELIFDKAPDMVFNELLDNPDWYDTFSTMANLGARKEVLRPWFAEVHQKFMTLALEPAPLPVSPPQNSLTQNNIPDTSDIIEPEIISTDVPETGT